jgi:hypothetical protein
MIISNNTFEGVHWDANAVQSIQTVAEALLNLTKVFRSQNIEIKSLLKVNEPVVHTPVIKEKRKYTKRIKK